MESTGALIVSATQIGYAAGLIFLVPLGDVLENRRFVCAALSALAAACVAAAFAQAPGVFLVASMFIGLTAVVTQLLIPYAAALAPPTGTGYAVGRAMAGLLLGVMLARPVSSLLGGTLGWRGVFVVAGIGVAALAVGLRIALPLRQPAPIIRYRELLGESPRVSWRLGYLEPAPVGTGAST